MRHRRTALSLVCWLSSAAGMARAQPAFEVASIRPGVPAQGIAVREIGRGRLWIEHASVQNLILAAFGLLRVELAGGPEWIAKESFDIVAKAPAPVGPDELYRMLQPLLAERFRLKTHPEKRNLPVYYLSIASPGKLPPPQPGNCVAADPRQPPSEVKGSGGVAVTCGSLAMSQDTDWFRLYGSAVKMPALTSRLTSLLGRHVLDRTGFAGAFDLDFRFAKDGSLAGLPVSVFGDAADPAAAPNLVTAMREHLGLRLQAGKAPMEVLVIDSVERPSEN